MTGVMGDVKSYRTWVAVGACVQQAASLMRLAGPGRVLCDRDLVQSFLQQLYTPDDFVFVEQQDPEGLNFRLDSIKDLYPSWVDRLFLRSRGEAFSDSFPKRCESLSSISDRIENTSHALTIVTGDPGCGKSAFMAALHQHLVSRKHSVIWCQVGPASCVSCSDPLTQRPTVSHCPHTPETTVHRTPYTCMKPTPKRMGVGGPV